MRHPNRMNEVMVAAPTVMATPGSYSFSHGGPGMVLGTNGALREPTIEEKERLMGYLGGVTSKEIATGVWLNERQRLRLIGNAWDAIAMEAVLACAKLINECAPGEAMVSEVPESIAHFAEVPKTDIPRQEVMTAIAKIISRGRARAHLVAPHAPRARRVLRRHPTRECISFALACVWLGSMAYFDVSSLSTSWIGTQCDDIHESVTRWMQVFGGGGGGGGGASGSNDTHASSAASSHASK
ncbi:hypothetical protein NFJ02_18g29070 [Pycnococcus provasolii]